MYLYFIPMDFGMAEIVQLFGYNKRHYTSFETFTAKLFQVEIFWVVTPCSFVVGYHVSGNHATSIFTLNMDAAWISERWYPSTTQNT
jgi:hypothetical protein